MSEKVTLQYIHGENLMAIKDLTVDFSAGDIHVISGGNGRGKTTASRMLYDLLRKKYPAEPLGKNGDAGEFEAKMSDGHLVKYTFDDASQLLTIYDPGGRALSKDQQRYYIRYLLGSDASSFDIDKFIAETQPKKRQEMLMQLCDLNLSEIDDRIKDKTEERRMANTRLRDHRARHTHPVDHGTKMQAEKPLVDAVALMDQLEAAEKRNREIEQRQATTTHLSNEAQANTSKIQSLQAEIDRLSARNEAIVQELTVIEDELGRPENQKAETDGIREQLRTTEQTNDQIKMARAVLEAAEAEQQYLQEATRLNDELASLNDERKEMLAKASPPASGLEFTHSGDDLLLNGIPINQASTAEIAIAALQIRASQLGGLKYVAFDGSNVDYENIRKVIEWLSAQGLQCMIEVAARTREGLELQISNADDYFGLEV